MALFNLAVGTINPPGLSLLLGNGDGTFQTPITRDAGRTLNCSALADFNGDGKLDLAGQGFGGWDSITQTYTNITVVVLLGNGDGTFQPTVNYNAGKSPGRVAVGDFNGDGKPDLAVTDIVSGKQIVPGNLWVLLGNGDGTFQSAVNYVAGVRPGPLVVGDFNGDGKADLAVVNVYSFNIFVLLNTCASAGIDLAFVHSNSTATISWPFPSTGFFLESTTSLNSTNWQAVVDLPTTNSHRPTTFFYDLDKDLRHHESAGRARCR